jgi:catechol 2,3-dioxygenase-like lactoylglutathione lyase family enzyme
MAQAARFATTGTNSSKLPHTQPSNPLAFAFLRARSREDVDRLHDLLRQIGATIIHGPQEGTWAPGYYSVLFEDPDGIRLEANFVPGGGVLQPGVNFNPAAGYST